MAQIEGEKDEKVYEQNMYDNLYNIMTSEDWNKFITNCKNIVNLDTALQYEFIIHDELIIKYPIIKEFDEYHKINKLLHGSNK